MQPKASAARSSKYPQCTGPASHTRAKLVDALWTFLPAFQRYSEGRTCRKKISPQRTRILACLHERGPQIMSELRDELGVTATNITALVDGLESDGLVVRRPHPEDRRATLIEITPKASTELAYECSAYRDRVGEIFSSLAESDRKELLRILAILQKNLDQSLNESKDA